MISNFITPPDFVDDDLHTVTIIDADPVDVETLAVLCSGHNESFNVYLYKADMNNNKWLEDAVNRSHAIIVNTEESELSGIKDRLCTKPNSYYYGSKNFLGNPNRINNVLDYFYQRANERQHSTNTL
jgi:hypothetical protein